MARRPTEDPARRGPERRTRTAEAAIDAPATSPVSAWPTAHERSSAPSAPDRPASVRVKKKRREAPGTRARRVAKRVGYAALAAALLAGLALVLALIVGPHQLF